MKKKYLYLIILAIVVIGLLAYSWSQNFFIPKNNNKINIDSSVPQKVVDAVNKLNSDPKDLTSIVTVANFKREKGEYEDAVKIYDSGLKARPDDTLLLMNQAELFERAKQFDKAEKNYLKVIEVNPKWVLAYRALANIYRYNIPEKTSKIPEILLKGLDNNKNEGKDAEFYGQLAVYYQDFNQKDKAIEYYKKLIQVDPNNLAAKEQLKKLEQ